MEVTLEELRRLRSMLTAHRLEHELLVTKMQVLREQCREIRDQISKRKDGLQSASSLAANSMSQAEAA